LPALRVAVASVHTGTFASHSRSHGLPLLQDMARSVRTVSFVDGFAGNG